MSINLSLVYIYQETFPHSLIIPKYLPCKLFTSSHNYKLISQTSTSSPYPTPLPLLTSCQIKFSESGKLTVHWLAKLAENTLQKCAQILIIKMTQISRKYFCLPEKFAYISASASPSHSPSLSHSLTLSLYRNMNKNLYKNGWKCNFVQPVADCVYATSAAAEQKSKRERERERGEIRGLASVYCCHAPAATPPLLCALPAPINKHRGAPLIVVPRRLCSVPLSWWNI